MSFRCVPVVVGLLIIGFSSATPRPEDIAALTGCSTSEAIKILNLPCKPRADDVKEWLQYFHSDMGGSFSPSEACSETSQVFDGSYFNGSHPDLATLKEWVEWVHEISVKKTYETSNLLARQVLSKPHPDLKDVKPMVSAGCAPRQALNMFKITPQPLLTEVKEWLGYFSSDVGGHFERARSCRKVYTVFHSIGSRRDLAKFKVWAEYFKSEMGGDSKDWESANLKTLQLLLGRHPHVAVLRKWVAYFSSQEGGARHTYESANHDALQMLATPHPCLEDLKRWARFFMGAQGGHNSPALAVEKANEILRNQHPELEDLRKTAEHFFTHEGGNHPHKEAVEEALKVCVNHTAVLSDTKVCDGEGDREGEHGSGNAAIIGILTTVCCGCGCIVLLGVGLLYRRSRQEGARAPFMTSQSDSPLHTQVEMNGSASPRGSKHSFGCTSCGAVQFEIPPGTP